MTTSVVDGESLSTHVIAEFGGDERRFELRLGEIRKLEQRAGAGIGEIYRRVSLLTFSLEDVRSTIKLGLVGGGDVNDHDAEAMVRAFVDGTPLNEHHMLAYRILAACFVGLDTSGKPRGLKQQDAPATSAPSTKPEPPRDTILATSIASPSQSSAP